MDKFTIDEAGSSPHVRGAQNRRSGRAGSSRIIPACAGSTFTHIRLRKGTWDHPRMCGEHIGDDHVLQA